MIKLLSIKKSDNPDKKLKATFDVNGKIKNTSFGATGYSDFIKSGGNEVKKKAYIARHSATESFKNPTDASTLARYILWNKPTLSASIADYRQRFNV